MKSVLVDYLSPIGHIDIINFYIKHLNKNFKFIYLNKAIIKKVNKRKNINYINLEKNFFFRIVQLYKLFKEFKKKKINKIVLLSYEPLVLLVLGILMDLDYFKIFVFEHDTLNIKKKFRFFLLNFLNKNINHLVYNVHSKQLLVFKFKRNAFFTHHPIIKIKNTEVVIKNNNTFLIPTRHHFDKNLIKNFIKKNKDLKIYILSKNSNIKKKLFSNFENVSLLEFIDERYINKIQAVYLPLDEDIYKYRISAWLYKGIAYNKKIFMEKNNLYKFEKKRFPNNIFLNPKNKINTRKLTLKKKIDISKYNFLLISDLKKILFK